MVNKGAERRSPADSGIRSENSSMSLSRGRLQTRYSVFSLGELLGEKHKYVCTDKFVCVCVFEVFSGFNLFGCWPSVWEQCCSSWVSLPVCVCISCIKVNLASY